MTLRGAWRRLCTALGAKDRDGDVGDELDSLLQMHIDDLRRTGVTEEEARRRALIELGGMEQVRQVVRDRRGLPSLEGWARDVKYAMRTLMRTPGFSLVAILVMALGIGTSVALFTVVRSVLLRPLPFPRPDRLVTLYSHDERSQPGTGNLTAPGDFYDWEKVSHGYEQMAIWRWSGYNMSSNGGDLPEFLNAGTCSWNLFATLGVNPALGRLSTPTDDQIGAEPTVILSWSFFKRRFNGDPGILGRTIRLNSRMYTVIGVLPEWFQYPDPKIQLWVPWQVDVTTDQVLTHFNHIFHVVARLKDGASAFAALQEVSAVEQQLYTRLRGSGPMEQDVVAIPLLEDVVGDVKTPLYVLLAAVVCLLSIACLNLSNLLVARSAARRREMAIRSALGSSRLSMIRQQLTESLLICLAGGGLGVLLAVGATRWLVGHWTELPRAYDVRPDGLAVSFALAITLLAGILAGLLPAISSTGGPILAALQDGSRGVGGNAARVSLRRALLTAEVALTVVLLIAAGLLFKSFVRLRTVDLGCTTKHVLTMTYFLRGEKYSKPEQIVDFDTQLLDKVRHLPGVEAAGLTNVVPGGGYYGDHEVWIPEHPAEATGVHRFAAYRTADPGYFSAMQIRLVRGRFFSDDERMERDKFVIVNEELVRQYFPGDENPIGKHLRVEWRTPEGESYEIVGVVGNTIYEIGKPVRPMMWFPILSGIPGNSGDSVLVVRSARDVLPLGVPIQRLIASLDRNLPVKNVLTMDQIVGESTANSSFSATLVLSFAALSLLLAAVGLYGVLAYLVTQRTVEIGIRMALGAKREGVLRLMLLDGLRPAALGLVLGVAASLGVTRLISSVLYGTSPLDPAVYLSVIATLLLSATFACLLPAWKAARIDPICALRTE
ncbi:ADOP family duplicated permease [Acidicapsa dinghuensis]|uniref:ADOP family duplicated permease n=2 Tax=Acidicapsa dinghuensis TaxID=2218256 RepID=A0ABW1ECN8_9BACT